MDCTGAVYAKKDLGKDWSLRAFSANVKGMQSFLFLADTKVFGIALNAWKVIGLTGSIIFGLRFLIQWLASERARKSVIPFGFWECSALGSLLTLAYFAIFTFVIPTGIQNIPGTNLGRPNDFACVVHES